ncbi:hypothetical protein DKT68_25940 [Micromonospora acroterricola]|uniref:Uncharacterized protein n=1 Tax=Micromonospora acroterricola TaxID=2202421 RepID=A0A317CSM5_9ACTN|nr:hypothetical protein [Micromonospora acroterricola]PWR05638.1 hypothetical protein DKT68_25940 [Micromonospora acroterricola]
MLINFAHRASRLFPIRPAMSPVLTALDSYGGRSSSLTRTADGRSTDRWSGRHVRSVERP